MYASPAHVMMCVSNVIRGKIMDNRYEVETFAPPVEKKLSTFTAKRGLVVLERYATKGRGGWTHKRALVRDVCTRETRRAWYDGYEERWRYT